MESWCDWQTILHRPPQDWHSDWHVFLLCIGVGPSTYLPSSERSWSALGRRRALLLSVAHVNHVVIAVARIRILFYLAAYHELGDIYECEPDADGSTAAIRPAG